MQSDLGEDGTFILGAGRCGSTLVSNILNTHPDVLSLSEFFSTQGTRGLLPGRFNGGAYWKQLSRPTKTVRHAMTSETLPNEFLYDFGTDRFEPGNLPPLLIATLPHLTDDPDALFDKLAKTVPMQPTQTVQEHHSMLFDKLREICGGHVWVERTGMSIMYIRLLPKLFPRAKIVMMYRDGRDVVLSYRKFKAIWPMIWGWKWSKGIGPNVLKLDAPSGRSKGLLFNETFFAPKMLLRWMLNTPPSLEVLGEFWSQATLQSLAEYEALPENQKMFLRFETLTSAPEQELSRLADFLAVKAEPEWLKQASGMPKVLSPRWTTLSAQEQTQLDKVTLTAREAVDDAFS